ncbi:hypothetical protein P4H66_27775 [Paenibacillus dokdonensis]|uniref:Adenylate kinase n=1 Tax=Paenibacillus dokdonensis TaxID=2567944 RepID=A0ABU6GWJ3_9BACL|nr:hypothetical protein [Paenibacillus dokdonensis]MEC0243623.1 hypothetical protein [Paenibacillus dokdonensis]
MKRIHIIGGSGSGKSYISALLSQKLNIPHYDLDDIFWDNNAEVYGIRAPEEQRNQKLIEIIGQDSWIIEGVYRSSWVDPSFLVAEKIIVLMPTLSVQEMRIWKRYEERISGIVTSKKKETLEGVKDLLEWNEQYNLIKLPHFIENCVYREKIIKVTDNIDILDMFKLH